MARQEDGTPISLQWFLAIVGMVAIVIVAALVVAILGVRPLRALDVAHKLTWQAVIPTPRGPLGGNIPETTKFKSAADCEAFGTAMTPRLKDWVRGRFNADWDHPVGVRFTCDVDGERS